VAFSFAHIAAAFFLWAQSSSSFSARYVTCFLAVIHQYQRLSICVARPSEGGGAQVVCMRVIFILNEIWAQCKIYILAGTLLGWNILLISYHLLLVLVSGCEILSSTFFAVWSQLSFDVATRRLVFLSHLIYFSYYYAHDSSLGFIFISFFLSFFPVPVCAITASGVPGCTFVSMNRFSNLCGWLAQRQGWRVKG
jgi:hypothetical protein